MTSHISKLLLGLTIVAALMTSCYKEPMDDYPVQDKSLLSLAKAQGDLNLFVAAAEAADIEAQLKAGVSYTLLAPTDSSFRAFLTARGLATVQDLQNQMGAYAFNMFIRYHILEHRVKAENISDGYILTFAETKQKNRLHAYMTRQNLNITINGSTASVAQPNIIGESGVIHKIDGVLSPLTLEGISKVNPHFSKLNIAIDFAGGSLGAILNDTTEAHTLFAPTDAAFNTFLNLYGYMDINTLLNLIGPIQIEDAIKYHLIKGRFKAEDFQNQQYQTLLAGASLQLSKDSSGTILILDDKGNPLVKIITTNIMAVNGVMHTIEQVLEYQ